MIHRNSLLIGLIVGTIVAVILYFFVLERPADAADSQNRAPVAERAEAPRLLFPVDCVIGQDCWYMAYVDLDSGEGYRDYMCGIRTYDAHKGTDIAPDQGLVRKLVVRAAAAGRVVGTRDGMVDSPMQTPEASRDAARCGNGVRLEHGDGWTTQYCHLAKGSVAVRTGEDVATGQRLGEIGSSGWSELPHLHFQLEKNEIAVDPFVGTPAVSGTDCDVQKNAGPGLWQGVAENNAFSYQPAQIVRIGLTTGVPDRDSAKFGEHPDAGPRDAGALVAFVVLFGAPEGTLIETEIDGPAGQTVFSGQRVIDQARVEYFSYSGKKRRGPDWPAGLYTARIVVSGMAPGGPFRVSERTDLILR